MTSLCFRSGIPDVDPVYIIAVNLFYTSELSAGERREKKGEGIWFCKRETLNSFFYSYISLIGFSPFEDHVAAITVKVPMYSPTPVLINERID